MPRRWHGLAGVLGPLVFAMVVIAVAAGRSDYHHATDPVSVLGEVSGRGAAVMNYGGFLLYGLLTLILAAGLHRALARAPGGWLGPSLLALYGLCYVAIAFAPCDPGCTGESRSLHERAHFLIGRLVIMLSFAFPLVLYPALAAAGVSRGRSLPLAILPVVGYLVFLGAVPGLTFGWQQRLWLLCTLAAVMLLGVWLVRSATGTRPSEHQAW